MLKWLYALLFFYTADTARLKRDYYGPNAIEDNSVFLNNNPINAGFTTRWRDEAVTIIFVGRPRNC
jgi:hypothetical protein